MRQKMAQGGGRRAEGGERRVRGAGLRAEGILRLVLFKEISIFRAYLT